MNFKKVLAVLMAAMMLCTVGIFAAEEAGREIVLEEGTYRIEDLGISGKVTVKAQGDAEVTIQIYENSEADNPFEVPGADVIFENVTLDFIPTKDVNYNGIKCNTIVYNGCTIKGQVFLYAKSDIFNNCTFIQEDSNYYNVWTYGSESPEFNNCTFISAGKSLLVYNEGGVKTHAVIDGCDFTATQTVEGKAAVEIGTSYQSFSVEINNSKAEGFASGSVSGNTLYNDKDSTETRGGKSVLVVVDDEVVCAKNNTTPVLAFVDSVGYETLDVALANAKDGSTIKVVGGTYSATPLIWKANDEDKYADNLKIVGVGNVIFELEEKDISFSHGSSNQYYISGSWKEIDKSISFENINFVVAEDNTKTKNELFVYAENTAFTDCTFENVSVQAEGAGKAEFDKCTFKNVKDVKSAIRDTAAAEIIITGCTFDNCGNGLHTNGALTSLTFTDNTFVNGEDGFSAVFVGTEGGDINAAEFTVTGNVAENYSLISSWNPTVSVSQLNALADLKANNNTVARAFAEDSVTYVATIGDRGYTSFDKALTATVAGDTIEMYADGSIDANGKIVSNINLNGNTLDINAKITQISGDVTINGPGKITLTDLSESGDGLVRIGKTSKLTFNNVDIYAENVDVVYVFGVQGELNINDGSLVVNGLTESAEPAGCAVICNNGGKTTIKDAVVDFDNVETGLLHGGTTLDNCEVTMDNVNEGIKLGKGSAYAMEVINSDIKIDGAFSGITLAGGKINLSNNSNIVVEDAAVGVFDRVNNDGLKIEEGSTLTKESSITIDETVTVGGTDIKLPDLKDLLEAYVAENPAYKAEGEVLFTVKADVYTPQVPVGKEGQTVEYFDIMPVIGDEEVVLPAGTTQNVQITLGEKVEGEAEVYHYVGDKWESVTAKTSGNTVTFAASSFSPYAVAYKSVALEESETAKSITAEIVPTTDERVYDVVVKADALKINRFRSAELDINFAGDKGMNYKVEGVGNVQVILPETSGKTVYEFNLNGTGANFITSEYITIAQVKIFGHGSATLKLEANEFNMVYATQGGTETVEEIFTPENDDAKFNVNTDEIEINIAPEEKILKVEVKFDKNTITDNENAYQQLYVRIYGGDLEEDIVYNLGKGNDEVELSDNVYTMSTPLRMGLIYNVEISGAGYRTYDHQVIMTGNKELTFWNNLKGGTNDPELKVDKDADDTAKRAWTLLEGDVLMDYTVDIYDLSAVVSYFNRTFTKADTQYAAYDINRDGKIDAVDIGRVLNSWGK